MRRPLVNPAIGVLVAVLCFAVVSRADRRKTYNSEARVMLNSSGAMVIALDRKLEFFDKDGKLAGSRKLRNNELVNLPQGGAAVGIIRYNDHSPSTLKPVAFELYDLAGNRLYSIKKPDFSSAVVSPTGKTIVGIDGAEGLPQSVLRFCDEHGKEISAITVEYFQGGRFSADGSVFVFATAQEGILAYSATGKALAGYGPGSVYDLSADGSVFTVGHDEVIRVYSGSKRIATVETDETVRVVAVSPRGSYWGWIGAGRAMVYATGTDTALCEIRLSTPGENFRSLVIGADGLYFAIGVDIDGGRELPQEKRHLRGRAVVYDLSGRVIAQKEVSYDSWNAKTPAVRSTRGGRTLAVITREEVYFMELPTRQPTK